MAILGVLKTIFDLVSALPTLFKFIREVQKEMALIKRNRDEEKRQEQMREVAEIVKEAQTTENEKAQRDALSSVIDDYNRK
jgi:Sec-independent protein translocase protein TatA